MSRTCITGLAQLSLDSAHSGKPNKNPGIGCTCFHLTCCTCFYLVGGTCFYLVGGTCFYLVGCTCFHMVGCTSVTDHGPYVVLLVPPDCLHLSPPVGYYRLFATSSRSDWLSGLLLFLEPSCMMELISSCFSELLLFGCWPLVSCQATGGSRHSPRQTLNMPQIHPGPDLWPGGHWSRGERAQRHLYAQVETSTPACGPGVGGEQRWGWGGEYLSLSSVLPLAFKRHPLVFTSNLHNLGITSLFAFSNLSHWVMLNGLEQPLSSLI